MKVVQFCNHTFLGDLLGPASIVVDCGANEGRFSERVVKTYGCRVEGLEPDPRLFAALPRLSRCTFHHLAVSANSGQAQLNLAPSMKSSLVFSGESDATCLVPTTSLPDLAQTRDIEHIDLLKIDIEGAELDLLQQLSEQFLTDSISQITVEFHEFLDPTTIPVIRQVIGRLESMGYIAFAFARTFGDMLFVNTGKIRLSAWDRIQIFEAKYRLGVTRMARRLVPQCFSPSN